MNAEKRALAMEWDIAAAHRDAAAFAAVAAGERPPITDDGRDGRRGVAAIGPATAPLSAQLWRCRAQEVLVREKVAAQRAINAKLRAEIDEVKLTISGGDLANLESNLAALELTASEFTAQKVSAAKAQLKARLAALEKQIALLPGVIAHRKEKILDRLYLAHHGAPAGAAPGPALPPLPPVTEQRLGEGASVEAIKAMLLDGVGMRGGGGRDSER